MGKQLDFSPTIAMLQLYGIDHRRPRMHFYLPNKRGKMVLTYDKVNHQTDITWDNVLIGKLSDKGVLTITQLGQMWPDWVEFGKPFLFALLQDPLQAAKSSAALSGICTFCGAELTDDRSKQAGYGPVCAENFNLPWGDKQPLPNDLTELFK